MGLKELTNENYAELTNGKNAVIDVWAEWCGQCKIVKNTLTEIANSGKFEDFEFLSCDAESNDDIVSRFNVRNLPTLIFIKNGEVVTRSVGTTHKNVIEETIKTIQSESDED